MLIMITDQCQMNCPHCMEDAKEVGAMMTLDTFKKAVEFGEFTHSFVYTISGGEPTENPLFLEMCKYLDSKNLYFTVVSNGLWLKDEKKCQDVKEVSSLYHCSGIQVYSNRAWYKEYKYVSSHKEDYNKIEKVIFDNQSPIFMQDLGRATQNKDAQKQVDKNPYFMSCLNMALLSRQIEFPKDLGFHQFLHKQFCKPSIDPDGNIHMSESKLCPSVGNIVTDNFDIIWQNMKSYKPCGRCKQYKKFMDSTESRILKARKVLDL